MSELRDNQHKFVVLIASFIQWLDANGYKVQAGDAYRSTDKLFVPIGKEGFEDDDKYSYQELLFYNKKTKLTYGKHNDRLALDLTIWKDEVMLDGEGLRVIGEKWEALGGRWGGRFGVTKEEYNGKIGWDAGHFEL